MRCCVEVARKVCRSVGSSILGGRSGRPSAQVACGNTELLVQLGLLPAAPRVAAALGQDPGLWECPAPDVLAFHFREPPETGELARLKSAAQLMVTAHGLLCSAFFQALRSPNSRGLQYKDD